MCGMWSRAKGGAAHTGKALRLGCSFGRRREKDAMFEVRKEAMRFEGVSAEEAAGVFGVGKIAAPLANRRAYSLWRRRLLNGHGCFALRIFRAWPAIEVGIHIRHSAPDGSNPNLSGVTLAIVQLARRARCGEARDDDSLAPGGMEVILAAEVPARPTVDSTGASEAHPPDCQ